MEKYRRPGLPYKLFAQLYEMPNVIKYNVICLLHQKICKFISYSRIPFKVTIFNGKFCVFSLLFTIYFFKLML